MLLPLRHYIAMIAVFLFICSSCTPAATEAEARQMFGQAVASAKLHSPVISQQKLDVSLQGVPLQMLYSSPLSAQSSSSSGADAYELLLRLQSIAQTVKLAAKQPGYGERTLQIEISPEDGKRMLKALWDQKMAQVENVKAQIVREQGAKLTAQQVRLLDARLSGAVAGVKAQLNAIWPALSVSSVYFLTVERKTGIPLKLVCTSAWVYTKAGRSERETVTDAYFFQSGAATAS